MLAVLLYDCVTWTLNSDLKRHINAFGTDCLSRIMEYHRTDLLSNPQLHDENELRPVTSLVHKHQLWLFGHIAYLVNVNHSDMVVSV